MSILSLKKTALGTALVASALASASPAMAQDYRYRRHDGGDTAAAAVVGGIVGIAIGALIASSGNKHNRCDGDRDDDRRCYRHYDRNYNGGYYNGYPQGGYYGNDGRYYRNDGRYDGRRYDDRGYDGDYRGY